MLSDRLRKGLTCFTITFLDDPSAEFLDALLGFRDRVLHKTPSTIRSLIDIVFTVDISRAYNYYDIIINRIVCIWILSDSISDKTLETKQ